MMREARKNRSMALEGDAKHLFSDVISSVGVVIALFVATLTNLFILDAVIARDADALREALRDAATGRRAEESVAVLQAAAARYAPAHYQQRVLQLLDEVLR